MFIAIPAVIKNITDSRKSVYVDTAKKIVVGARSKFIDGKLQMTDPKATYYIPHDYITMENEARSPYGDLTESYIGVVFDGMTYKYYWIGTDDAGQGVAQITPIEELDDDDIVSDLTDNYITSIIETTGIGNRSKIYILDTETETWNEVVGGATKNVTESGGVMVCKPATTLHTATCALESSGCGIGVGNGKTITYGTLVNGTPKPGDAYDCKVKENGGFTERFYYLGSEGATVSLIYYKRAQHVSYSQNIHAYRSNGNNWYGPDNAYQYLPSTSVWDNKELIAPGTRQILTEAGGKTTGKGSHTIDPFNYTDRAARLITAKEIKSACGVNVGSFVEGELNNCKWLLENIELYTAQSSNASASGYWTEVPRSSDSGGAFFISGGYREVSLTGASESYWLGVRAVITIKETGLG